MSLFGLQVLADERELHQNKHVLMESNYFPRLDFFPMWPNPGWFKRLSLFRSASNICSIMMRYHRELSDNRKNILCDSVMIITLRYTVPPPGFNNPLHSDLFFLTLWNFKDTRSQAPIRVVLHDYSLSVRGSKVTPTAGFSKDRKEGLLDDKLGQVGHGFPNFSMPWPPKQH